MFTIVIIGLLVVRVASVSSPTDSYDSKNETPRLNSSKNQVNYFEVDFAAQTDLEGPEKEWVQPTDGEIYIAVASSMLQYHKHQLTQAVIAPFEDLMFSETLFPSIRPPKQHNEVCYDDLGCFNKTGPFAYLDMLPDSPRQVKTKFLFFKRHPEPEHGVSRLVGKFANMTNAWKLGRQIIDPSGSTAIIIHGFLFSCDSRTWVGDMVFHLLHSANVSNVICVDWSHGAVTWNYWKAAANTRLVGKQIANLLQGFQQRIGLRLDKVHLIGHSLGSHLAGFTGAFLPGIGRITGLDPAGFLFKGKSPEARLDKTDADFVDVIHTNAKDLNKWFGLLWTGGFGTNEQLGHVDFFPNGGEDQVGCPGLIKAIISPVSVACSHNRACLYFTESVKSPCRFMASPCKSYDDFLAKKEECFACTAETCAPMGYHAYTSPAEGSLFLKTESKEPFCGYMYLVSLEISKDQASTYGKVTMSLSAENFSTPRFIMTEYKYWQFMEPGDTLSEIIVTPPIPLEPNTIELLYDIYDGWDRWLWGRTQTFKIAKIMVIERFGKKLYLCKDVVLNSGKTVRLPVNTRCTLEN